MSEEYGMSHVMLQLSGLAIMEKKGSNSTTIHWVDALKTFIISSKQVTTQSALHYSTKENRPWAIKSGTVQAAHL